MNSVRHIRERLGMTQAALALELGVTQGNVSHYENGQDIPPEVARRLISTAAEQGVSLSFDDVYRDAGDERGN